MADDSKASNVGGRYAQALFDLANDEKKLSAVEADLKALKSMSADKIAPLVAYLCSDAASEISGQIFTVRKNEIFLMSPPRPIRSAHRSEGWTPETIASELIPALKPSMRPLERSADVFAWDPV